ncbi:MAG: Maf family protein [Clostridiales Family XIII bacterium]|jgi:septum formation protein|nr:Maf family protein [Clostridiales Family XIII bacterium]
MSAGLSPLADIPIVLASGSPRRIEMFRTHGFEPIVRPADVDENIPVGLNARQAVMYLALKKALASAEAYGASAEGRRLCTPPFIVAADTAVCKDGLIFGKPASAEEARRTLAALRNSGHTVCTGVAILRDFPARAGDAKGAQRCGDARAAKRVFCDEARVFFKDYTDGDIEAYIATGEPFDKAGGYAVQGGFSVYVDRVEGDVNTVMGFPWARAARELAAMADAPVESV